MGASDPVFLRTTGNGATKFLQMYRISEHQNANDQEVDFLSNHDSGSAAGDVAFVTAAGTHFVQDYNTSVITQYCVEMVNQYPDQSKPFADYVSCNGPDALGGAAWVNPHLKMSSARVEPNMTYTCVCDNLIDRVIGHQNFTEACGSKPDKGHHGGTCNCTAASLARSAERVGRLNIFLPWMCGRDFEHVGDGTCYINIAFGQWFSTPTASQCPEGEPIGSLSRNGQPCTWRRGASARIVRGAELLNAGWNHTMPCLGQHHGSTVYPQPWCVERSLCCHHAPPLRRIGWGKSIRKIRD